MNANTNTTEIVEGLRRFSQVITFMTLDEAKEIVKEHNEKSPHKLELTQNSDGSMTLTESKSGIGLTIDKVEIQG